MGKGFKTEEDIGARINELRQSLDMTVPSLARKVGVTNDAIQRLMRGESATQYMKLIKLARALNTTPNVILGFTDPGVLHAALEACFDALGLPEDQARILSETVEQVLLEPDIPGIDPVTQVRSQAPVLFRQLSKLKRQK